MTKKRFVYCSLLVEILFVVKDISLLISYHNIMTHFFGLLEKIVANFLQCIKTFSNYFLADWLC